MWNKRVNGGKQDTIKTVNLLPFGDFSQSEVTWVSQKTLSTQLNIIISPFIKVLPKSHRQYESVITNTYAHKGSLKCK